MNTFIDTNIYLKFYHYTDDDLDNLLLLKNRIEQGELNILITDQVLDEFERNRENKINESLKSLKEYNIGYKIPQLIKPYDEITDLKEAQKSFNTAKTKILEKLNDQIESRTLKADEVLDSLFEQATLIEETMDVFEAEERYMLGKPPGKNKSYGDALSWINLLNHEDLKGEDFYFISDDKDYKSVINSSKFNDYLKREWKTKMESTLYFYTNISKFLRDHFPALNLENELNKEDAVSRLIMSGDFMSTHIAISELDQYESFSGNQISNIVESSIKNSQIAWIATDSDVSGFFNKIYSEYADKIPEEFIETFKDIFIDEEEPDLPF